MNALERRLKITEVADALESGTAIPDDDLVWFLDQVLNRHRVSIRQAIWRGTFKASCSCGWRSGAKDLFKQAERAGLLHSSGGR